MPEADQVEVLAIVKLRFGISGDETDALINSYVRELGRRIRHYCSIEEMPEELTDVWASSVMDALRIEQAGVPGIAENVIGELTIKIGDTSVAPAARSGDVSAMNKSSIDEIVVNYKADLRRYRRVRWSP